MLVSTTIQSPIVEDANSVIRIGNTRVTFLSVMNAYEQGATPEEIVQTYPSLQLADVYATIAYYLQNRDEMDTYLADSRQQVENAHRNNQNGEIRDRLLARQTTRS